MAQNLSTQRTKLRRFNSQDLDLIQLLESDPEVMKHTPMRVALAPEQSLVRLQTSIEKQKTLGDYGVWAVELKGTNDFIGWFMLLPAEVVQRTEYPELGFMIVKKFWKQGFATEVARVLIRYCFEDLRHSGVSAVVEETNVTSITVLKKLGFVFLRNFTSVNRVDNREIVLIAFQRLRSF